MWINPTIKNAIALQKWSDVMKNKHKDITLLPSFLIKHAKEVKIGDLSRGPFHYKEVKYCKFNTIIEKIPNIDAPWYKSGNKCYKKVDFKDNVARCYRCRTENIDYEKRKKNMHFIVS